LIINDSKEKHKSFEFELTKSNKLEFKHFKLSDFYIYGIIGRGSYGKILLAEHNEKRYALKCVSKELFLEKCNVKNLKEERKIMMKLQHPFITKLEGTFQDKNNIFFVLEYVQCGDIYTLLQSFGVLNEIQTKFIVIGIIQALEYLHGKKIIYRDLKLKNVLLDEYGYVKLCDFGFSKYVEDKTFSVCGTPYYVSPEILLEKGHTLTTDYWSLGILTFELLTGKPPFFKKNRNELFSDIINNEIKFSDNIDVSKNCQNFVKELLHKNNEKRLGNSGIQSIKDHSWFSDIKWNDYLQKKRIQPFFRLYNQLYQII